MKLINHNKNNSYDIDTYVMRGTIEMSQKEWLEALRFIEKEYKKAVKECNTNIRDGINSSGMFENLGFDINPFDIGTTATSLIVKKYGLKNYKEQNYGILLTANL